MEITSSLPDKAHKPIRRIISKSPDISASGGTARSLKEPSSNDRAYAVAPVGIFVGIYGMPSPEDQIQPSDMNSVGGPVMLPTIPEIHKKSPAQARPAAFQLPSLPKVAQ